MIKTIVTMIVTAIAGLVGYLVSDSFRERLAQKQRDKIASEVARGDEAAVNARTGVSGRWGRGFSSPLSSSSDVPLRGHAMSASRTR